MALLTVDEYKAAFPTSMPDARVLDLIEAAEADIVGVAGPVTETTEYGQGGYPKLVIARPIGTITSVTERADSTSELELEVDDYRIDGYILVRLDTGTNPRRWWDGLVKVLHTPADRYAERKRAQMALVQLDVQRATGVSSITVGPWSEKYSEGSDYAQSRQDILASLRPVLVA